MSNQNQAPRATAQTVPMPGVAVATERPRSFSASAMRVVAQLRPERTGLLIALALCAASVLLSAVGPMILGEATNVVVDGAGGVGTDFTRLARILAIAVLLYLLSAAFGWAQAWLLINPAIK